MLVMSDAVQESAKLQNDKSASASSAQSTPLHDPSMMVSKLSIFVRACAVDL